jgi:glycosyltransferase involved in cell wall biosynthesis
MRPDLACLFERFPSFTQTFVAREVAALQSLGLQPALYSIRSVSDEAIRHFPAELVSATTVLPPAEQVTAEVTELKKQNLLPPHAVVTLRQWEGRPDKNRVYEALWTGHRLNAAGIRHVHTHFAGIGARTAWWIRRFYGLSYSFTGHANDLFCPDQQTPVTLDHLVRDAALVITVSNFTRDWLRQRHPHAAGRIHRVYNGMTIPSAPPPWPREGPPVIAAVGRLIEKKGFADLIAACAILRQQGTDFRCTIAGDGPLEESLRGLINSSGLARQITLAGPLSQPEVTSLLAQSRVFALPCVTEASGGMDVLPTVIMEAMAAALPCVSTTTAGVPEMIAHGRTGALVSPGKPAELAAALTPYLENPELAATHGRAGHRMATDLFSIAVTTPHLLRLLAAHTKTHLPAQLVRSQPSLLLPRAAFLARRFSAPVRAPRFARNTAALPDSSEPAHPNG